MFSIELYVEESSICQTVETTLQRVRKHAHQLPRPVLICSETKGMCRVCVMVAGCVHIVCLLRVEGVAVLGHGQEVYFNGVHDLVGFSVILFAKVSCCNKTFWPHALGDDEVV